MKKNYNILFTIASYILNIIILSYMFLYVITPLTAWHAMTDMYNYADYDIVVHDCTQSYLDNVLLKETKISSYVIEDISLIEHEIKSNNRSITTELIKTFRENSLSAIIGSVLPKELLLSYDKKLLCLQNAILLPQNLAAELDVHVGDTVYLEDSQYLVAGIFLNDMLIDGIVLSRNTETSYNSIYIKFNDPEQGINYIKENYYGQGYLQAKYGENFLNLATPEDIADQVGYYDIRTVQFDLYSQLHRAQSGALAHIVVGIGAIFITQIYVKHKNFEKKIRHYAIKISFGYNKKRLILKYFISSLCQEIFVFFGALYLYTILYRTFLRDLVVLELLPVFIVTIILAAILLSLLSQYELRRSTVLQVLRTEE